MLKLSKLNETIFGDMLKRSYQDEVRKEDEMKFIDLGLSVLWAEDDLEINNYEKKEIEAKTSLVELFARTWKECRNFVLPMNPMRRELEWAVREVLSDLGIPSSYRKKKKN